MLYAPNALYLFLVSGGYAPDEIGLDPAWKQYLEDNSSTTRVSLPDQENQFLLDKLELTGPYNTQDLWVLYLDSLSIPDGALPDRFVAWLDSGGAVSFDAYIFEGVYPLVVGDFTNGIYGIGDGTTTTSVSKAGLIVDTETHRGYLSDAASAKSNATRTGVFVVTMPDSLPLGNEYILTLQGTGSNSSSIRFLPDLFRVNMTVDGAGSQGNSNTGAPTAGATHVIAGVWALNNIQAAMDGVAATADTNATRPTVTAGIYLGTNGNESLEFTGTIHQFACFSTQLNATQLATITNGSWPAA